MRPHEDVKFSGVGIESKKVNCAAGLCLNVARMLCTGLKIYPDIPEERMSVNIFIIVGLEIVCREGWIKVDVFAMDSVKG